jgi:hypothetical protein
MWLGMSYRVISVSDFEHLVSKVLDLLGVEELSYHFSQSISTLILQLQRVDLKFYVYVRVQLYIFNCTRSTKSRKDLMCNVIHV